MLVRAVRDAVGSDIGLAIDCHWNYGVEAAIQLARALEGFQLLWLEDPIPPENIPAIGEVQRNTRTTIATGENHYFRIDFERLIREAGLRVLAPDVQKMGLIEGKKLADMAEMNYVNLTWHNISSPWERWPAFTCAPRRRIWWRSSGTRRACRSSTRSSAAPMDR